MKNIEERAYKTYPSEYESSLYYNAEDDPNVELREAYIQGATEQKAIDDGYIAELEDALVQTPCYEEGFEEGYTAAKKEIIDKACEWLKENIFDYIAVGNTDYGKPYDIDLCSAELFVDFRKAMEEI